MNDTNKDTSLLGILSGKDAVKFEIVIEPKSIVILCVGLLLVIVIGSFAHKKIQG